MRETMPRRYLAEFVGTFGIVFAPVALSGATTLNGADASLAAAAWVSGLAVLAMIYTFGHISAAHFNPAVTLAFAAAGRFPWRFVVPYAACQFFGGIAAATLGAAFFGPGHGKHVPTVSPVTGAGLEASLTFLLMLVIISVGTDKRADGAIPGIAIGLTVVANVWIGGAATGGSMNPARSLGPNLFGGTVAVQSYWVYVVGPVLGAVLAARLYEALRGGDEHARCAPNEVASALQKVSQIGGSGE